MINMNNLMALLIVAVLLIAGALYLTASRAVTVQVSAPTGAEVAEKTVTVPVWSLLVELQDAEGAPVDGNVYLLYEKPKNIYTVPTEGIYKSGTTTGGSITFDNVRTGKTYFVLAVADGYYNAGTEVEMPEEIPKDNAELKIPVTVTVTLDKKGTIIGVQVPLMYQGSAADVAKLVYDADTETYKTELQFVAGTDGVVKYDKIYIELNTTTLGSATIDKMTVHVGDAEFTYDNVTGNKSIEFDTEQVIAEGATLPIKMEIEGTGLDSVSGQLFKVTLYDVQEGSWTAVVEGPA